MLRKSGLLLFVFFVAIFCYGFDPMGFITMEKPTIWGKIFVIFFQAPNSRKSKEGNDIAPFHSLYANVESIQLPPKQGPRYLKHKYYYFGQHFGRFLTHYQKIWACCVMFN